MKSFKHQPDVIFISKIELAETSDQVVLLKQMTLTYIYINTMV